MPDFVMTSMFSESNPSIPPMSWQPVDIQVKKLHEDSTIPTKNKETDLGWDIYCVADEDFLMLDPVYYEPPHTNILSYPLVPGECKIFRTGIAMKPVHNEWGFILCDRGGMGVIKNITVLGGVIDHGYTGEWKVCLANLSKQTHIIHAGDKIVQAILTPRVPCNIQVVDDLGITDRGTDGFASSGR